MAKIIQLTKGKVTVVGDDVWEWASKHKWSALWTGSNWYAVRVVGTRSGQKMIYLHREIMNAPDGVMVDHRDGDGLNNLNENLRFATNAENMRNRGPNANNTSGRKGVTWDKSNGRWMAKISPNGRTIHLGYFDDLDEAARAYDRAAKEHFGAFAWTNFDD